MVDDPEMPVANELLSLKTQNGVLAYVAAKLNVQVFVGVAPTVRLPAKSVEPVERAAPVPHPLMDPGELPVRSNWPPITGVVNVAPVAIATTVPEPEIVYSPTTLELL